MDPYIVGYVFGALVTFVLVARYLPDTLGIKDKTDLAMSSILCLLAAVVWPLIGGLMAIGWLLMGAVRYIRTVGR